MEVDPGENLQEAGWERNFTLQLRLKTAVTVITCHFFNWKICVHHYLTERSHWRDQIDEPASTQLII